MSMLATPTSSLITPAQATPALQRQQPTAKRSKIMLLGPAFIAAIGYIDPGNFATNIEAGSSFGYRLLWVVLWANLMAMFIQYLSAKLGIVTGKNLAQHLGDRLPRWAVVPYWLQAELIAMATDLAEFIGAAVGFQLLLGVSLFEGAVITGLLTLGILQLRRWGQKPIEAIIGGLLLLVAAIYVAQLLLSHPAASGMAAGLLVPGFDNGHQVYLAAGILGATVMPHVIYLHSALFEGQQGQSITSRLRASKLDVSLAMTIAGFVNVGIIAMAAAVFHFSGYRDIASIENAYMTLTPMLGKGAALLFGLSLIASGLSSSVVGTLAGEVVMQGFVRFSIPVWVRRLVTMLPAFVVIAMGIDTTKILVMSQVVLSFGIALALVPLLKFTGNKELMGRFANTKLLKCTGVAIVLLVVVLNTYLLFTLLQ
ncbi:Nramp family divalent metal transporter [Shewanella submarina]|uniref:Divalent metal cation transporter MntH n=1 Tax=Shewanella submarina TaxID=2016376 RepID=A0ABV7GD99_9GAMM|nr:Nramp family divalent metal transporter [Shewanella submarina]